MHLQNSPQGSENFLGISFAAFSLSHGSEQGPFPENLPPVQAVRGTLGCPDDPGLPLQHTGCPWLLPTAQNSLWKS